MERSSEGVTAAPRAPTPAGRATVLIALSACGFGAIAILVTLATRAGAPLLSVLSWRYVVAAILLAIIAAVTGALRPSRTAAKVLLAGGLAQAVIAGLSLSALHYIPAATLSFLFYTYPAFVAVIARMRHSEPMTRTRLFALGLSLAGIAVMIGTPGGVALHPLGITLALVSALLYAAYVPLIAEVQRGLGAVATSMYVCAGAALFLTMAAVVRNDLMIRLPATAWAAVAALSLLSTVVAFLMFMRGLRVLGPVRTAIVSTIEPFFTALLGAWLLGQPLTPKTLAGGALIAGAVILLHLRRNGARTGPAG